jgi:hypothetical protein
MKRSRLVPVAVALAMPLTFVGRTVSAQAPRQTSDVVATLRPDGSQKRVNEFRTKGNLSEKGASFLARTRLDLLKPEQHVLRFVATFPTTSTANVTFRITPKPGSPVKGKVMLAIPRGAASAVKYTHTAAGKSHTFRLSFVVPAGGSRTSSTGDLQPAAPAPPVMDRWVGVPVRAVAYVPLRSAAVARHAARTRQDYPLQALGKEYDRVMQQLNTVLEDTYGVEMTAVITQGASDHVGDAEEGAREFLTGAKDSKNPISTLWGVKSEIDGTFSSSYEYRDMVAILDQYQEMAEHPSNELTQKMYEEDPASKQRILDEIANVRLELKLNQAVLVSNSMVTVGSGLFQNALLTAAIAPLTAYTSRTMKELMKGRLDDVKKMITAGRATGRPPKPGTATPGSSTCTGAGAGANTKNPGTFVEPQELAPKPAPKAVEQLYGCKPTDGLTLAIHADDGLAPSPPGVFTAVYEGVQREFSADGTLSHTTTESGTITFRVKPDGRMIDGSGTGKASFERKDDKSRTFGETAYTFPVTGFVNAGAACLVVAQGTQPMDFETVQTYFDPNVKPYYGNQGVPTDMLLAMTTWPALGGNPHDWPVGGALRLRHGSTHTWSVDVTSRAGRRTTARSTLTIP